MLNIACGAFLTYKNERLIEFWKPTSKTLQLWTVEVSGLCVVRVLQGYNFLQSRSNKIGHCHISD